MKKIGGSSKRGLRAPLWEQKKIALCSLLSTSSPQATTAFWFEFQIWIGHERPQWNNCNNHNSKVWIFRGFDDVSETSWETQLVSCSHSAMPPAFPTKPIRSVHRPHPLSCSAFTFCLPEIVIWVSQRPQIPLILINKKDWSFELVLHELVCYRATQFMHWGNLSRSGGSCQSRWHGRNGLLSLTIATLRRQRGFHDLDQLHRRKPSSKLITRDLLLKGLLLCLNNLIMLPHTTSNRQWLMITPIHRRRIQVWVNCKARLKMLTQVKTSPEHLQRIYQHWR